MRFSFFGRVLLSCHSENAAAIIPFASTHPLGGDVRRVAGIGQPVIVSVVVGVWRAVGVGGQGLVRGGVRQWAVGDGRGVGRCSDGCNGRSSVDQRLRRGLGSGQGQDGGEYELEEEEEDEDRRHWSGHWAIHGTSYLLTSLNILLGLITNTVELQLRS